MSSPRQKLAAFIIICFAGLVVSEKFAYVSVLSSDSFLTAAKVLAHRLKSFNTTIPYIVIVTEDISFESIDSLKSQGVVVIHDKKIDTPYIKTHKARKYHYTKIRLWEMEEYDAITHLDLDVLPLTDISSIFHCGTFCASFRHSDMFNSGVFVLKPNKTIFYDMVQRVQSLPSYDGGDQGFLNSYFSDLKYAPMFNASDPFHQPYNSSMRRLSAAFNYDIGMYYLNGGRYLIEPKIIHYTLGPTKPWIWWTYPLFDLNYVWLEARQITESAAGDFYIISEVKAHRQSYVSHLIYIIAILLSLQIVPMAYHPTPTWIFFSINTSWAAVTLSTMYAKIRRGIQPPVIDALLVLFLILATHSISGLIVGNITPFSKKVVTVIAVIVINQIAISFYIRHILFETVFTNNRCKMLKNRIRRP
ncbi:unnamed protein product [Caenorhabditis bovis]|uniref:Uncharacterized protein n=1 Tax=Caenorhabditis bovis TaxID=2654633 RepID=A0A8S1F8W7_9PELO|nr:unnamed protein product [Caenorhabditis bovis]